MGEEEENQSARNLVPSQAIKRNDRRRRRPKPKKPSENGVHNTGASLDNVINKDGPSEEVKADGASNGNSSKVKKPKSRSRKPKRPSSAKDKSGNGGKNNNNNKTNPGENNESQHGYGAEKKTKPKKRNRNKNKNRFPWRKEIPPNTVDPISLEPLVSLPYPPFALTITSPYIPIPEWPILKEGDVKSKKNSDDCNTGRNAYDQTDIGKREEQLLSEQWGGLLPDIETANEKKENSIEANGEEGGKEDGGKEDGGKEDGGKEDGEKHYHLFDGRVLAVYLVSTLQFIDPLNRRDLTRDEVKNLDAYLAKHRLKKMKVLEAYDDKGVTLSSAGANAQTQSGRLRMRQEEARNLLSALFQDNAGAGGSTRQQQQQIRSNRSRRRGQNGGNGNGHALASANEDGYNDNVMARQYAAYEFNNQGHDPTYGHSQYEYSAEWNNDDGIYGNNDGGMLLIDDDYNPGLRGGLPNATLSGTNETPSEPPSWHGHRARVRASNFPALPTTNRSESELNSSTSNNNAVQSKERRAKPAPSKTLSKIGNLVQKRNPKQLEKERKARELARRKAEYANMPYEEAVRRMALDEGATANEIQKDRQNVASVETQRNIEPTEGQLHRNRNLASALGVAPSTARQGAINAGWARPTSVPRDLDEFGNELNTTQYSDSLIIEARERMTELLRLEKKWLSFLKDDKAASCPLKAMQRPMRKFVHAYSDFWNLHTQSFDPEPKRYIHCVKLLETRAPRPLLSDAVRFWRGPAPSVGFSASSLQQPAGEETMSSAREFVQTEEREPLKLEPRTFVDAIAPPPGAMFDMVSSAALASVEIIPASSSQQPAARFAPILAERERTKLKLDPRTKPLELPKYHPPPIVNAEEMARQYELSRRAAAEKERREIERKRSVLAAAFASDDEDDSESDWEISEAAYSGSDDEE